MSRKNAIPPVTFKDYDFRPRNPPQELMEEHWDDGLNLVFTGPAGCGKTFGALMLAAKSLGREEQKRIIIIRSAVATRDIGHLPGAADEKLSEYESPYIDFFGEKEYRKFKYDGLIKFTSTSFLRSMTFTDSIIIVDEINNLTLHELDTVVTRSGENTRLILMGDERQTDLVKREKCGMVPFLLAINSMPDYFAHVRGRIEDVVRSDLTREYLFARERMGVGDWNA